MDQEVVVLRACLYMSLGMVCAVCISPLDRFMVKLDCGAWMHNTCFVEFSTWYETECNLRLVLTEWRRACVARLVRLARERREMVKRVLLLVRERNYLEMLERHPDVLRAVVLQWSRCVDTHTPVPSLVSSSSSNTLVSRFQGSDSDSDTEDVWFQWFR